MSSSESPPININISKSANEINEKYSEFKDYIIVNNTVLQNENKQLIVQVKELESQISTQENEIDSFENKVRYMKGLLQNLNELRKEYNKVKDISIKFSKDLANNFDVINSLYKKLTIWSLMIISINIYYIYYSMFLDSNKTFRILNNTIISIGIIICLSNNKSIYDKIKFQKSINNKIKNKNKEDIDDLLIEIKRNEDNCLSLDFNI